MEPMEWVVVAVILIVVFLFFKNAMTTHTAATVQTKNAIATTKSGTCAGDCFKGGTTIAAGVTEPNSPPTFGPSKLVAGQYVQQSSREGLQNVGGQIYLVNSNGSLSPVSYAQAIAGGASGALKGVWLGNYKINYPCIPSIPTHIQFPVNPPPLPTPIAIQTGATCRLQYRQQEPTSTVPKAIRL